LAELGEFDQSQEKFAPIFWEALLGMMWGVELDGCPLHVTLWGSSQASGPRKAGEWAKS
jgi:hypothetical protein